MNKNSNPPLDLVAADRQMPFGRHVSPAILETHIQVIEKDLENEKIAHCATTMELAGWINRVRQLERLNGVLARRIDELEGRQDG